jgi:hypothetical protein
MANIGLDCLIDRFDGNNFQTLSTCMEMFFHQEEQWNRVNGFMIRYVDPIY